MNIAGQFPPYTPPTDNGSHSGTLSMDDNGEPIAMLEGVSVWPTVLLRVLGIILTGYFIWRAKCTLRENLAGIATDIMGIDLK
jgi:hypothetical protein